MTKYDPIVSQLQKLKVRIDELKTEQQQVQQRLVGCPKHFNDVATNSNPVRKLLEAMNGSQLFHLVTVDLANVAVEYRKHLQRILPNYPLTLDHAWDRHRIYTIIQNAIIKDEGRSVFSKEYRQWRDAFDAARAPFADDLQRLNTIKSDVENLQVEFKEIESKLPKYKVMARGIESQTRSRRVSAKTTVYAISEEEAQAKVEAAQDDLVFEENEFYDDADSEIEIEEYEVELISEEGDDAAAG